MQLRCWDDNDVRIDAGDLELLAREQRPFCAKEPQVEEAMRLSNHEVAHCSARCQHLECLQSVANSRLGRNAVPRRRRRDPVLMHGISATSSRRAVPETRNCVTLQRRLWPRHTDGTRGRIFDDCGEAATVGDSHLRYCRITIVGSNRHVGGLWHGRTGRPAADP